MAPNAVISFTQGTRQVRTFIRKGKTLALTQMTVRKVMRGIWNIFNWNDRHQVLKIEFGRNLEQHTMAMAFFPRCGECRPSRVTHGGIKLGDIFCLGIKPVVNVTGKKQFAHFTSGIIKIL